MQAVVLAAGASVRFFPFAQTSHKSMISLCGKPILAWTLDALRKAGVGETVVVVAQGDKAIQEVIDKYRGLKIKKVVQEQGGGMAGALLSAKKHLGRKFLVLFGSQIDAAELVPLLLKTDAMLLVDETDEPWKYGILKLAGNRAVGMVEKPKKGKEPSNIRASGIYLLTSDFVKVLEKTPEKEYQFEYALNRYMAESAVETVRARQPVLQLKYPWDLFELRDWLLERLPEKQSRKAEVAKTATVSGKVIMEDGARIFDYALVQGPVYIGKDAVVGAYSILRQGSVLEEKAEIQRFVDCARSIIGPDSQIHTGFVGDSILGSGIRIGAGLVTANRRIDRKNIDQTGRSYMGALIGDNVGMGVNVTTMPGIVIGAGSSIGPNSVVMKNLSENTLYYTDYKAIAKAGRVKYV